MYGTYSLEGAAVKAAQLLGAKTHDFGFTDEQIKEIVAREMRGYSAKQKYFRGLYCGGTFTEEGLIYYSLSLIHILRRDPRRTARREPHRRQCRTGNDGVRPQSGLQRGGVYGHTQRDVYKRQGMKTR